MMENKNHLIPDDELNAVAGGAGRRPAQRFQEGDLVTVTYVRNGTSVSNYGRVSDFEYDEELGEWTYQVEFGHYVGTMWVVSGYNDTYYPQSRLSSWSGRPNEHTVNTPTV